MDEVGVAAPTQPLRDLIKDLRSGQADLDDLDNALLDLERLLRLPLTQPDPTP